MGARLKEILTKGKLAKVFGMGQMCGPKMVEIIGNLGGFDAVWLDQEHAGLTIEQIEHACRAARGCGLDSFVRMAPTGYEAIMQPLEAGAGGIMAAQVRSAREASLVVEWAKFYPEGLRGVNATGVDGRYGSLPLREYMRRANAETFVAIQIENVDAVTEVEEIAAIPGIDILFVGPADLTQSMGIPAEWGHPRLWEALERISRAAQNHGVHWAILPNDLASARRCVDLGCRMLSLGFDVWAVRRGVKTFQEEYADFFRQESQG